MLLSLRSAKEQVALVKRNTHGFSVLPDELLLEIISHFELPPMPSAKRPSAFQNRDRFQRREALIALSLTCRSLRRVFHPYIWERIEVLSGMIIRGRIVKRDELRVESKKEIFYKELLRQLRIVTRLHPALAKHVRIVDVEITDFNLHRVFLRLGVAFSRFPNLHTVMITQHVGRGHGIPPATQMAVRLAFQKHLCYPQIQSAILSAIAYPLLELCPNLHSFEACVGFNLDYLLKFLKNTPGIQRFSSGQRVRPWRALELAKEIPSLQEISVYVHSYDLSHATGSEVETRTQITTLIRSLNNLRVLTIENTHVADRHRIREMLLKIASPDLKGLEQMVIRSRPPYSRIPFIEIVNF